MSQIPTLTKVTSSQIWAIGYDAEAQKLYVQFVEYEKGTKKAKAGPFVYEYFSVPPDVAQELAEAKSQGSYLHTRIKGNFVFAKLLAPVTTAEDFQPSPP